MSTGRHRPGQHRTPVVQVTAPVYTLAGAIGALFTLCLLHVLDRL